MNADEIRGLWARFVDGEELPAAEQAALVAGLEADAELRAALLEDVQLDGALRALADARRDGDAFTATVADALSTERDATRFVRKVEQRLAEPPPEPAGTRQSGSGFHRVSRRFLRRAGASDAGLKAALVAAGAFFAVLLLAGLLSKPPQRGRGGPPLAPRTLPRVPEPEEPRTNPPAPRSEPPREAETPKRVPKAPEGPEYRTPEPLEVPAPKAVAKTPEVPVPPAVPAPAPLPVTRAEGEAPIAPGPRVTSVVDQVYYVGGQTRVESGHVLAHGQEIYTVGRGEARLRYEDGTTIDVRPDSFVQDRSDARGLRLQLRSGFIAADIKKQPEGRPMLFETPHAVAMILGTKIRLSSGAGSTLDVDEGKVRFQRLSDKAAVEVEAGQSVTASAAVRDLKPRISFPQEFTIRFGPADAPRADRVYLDSGAPFSPAKGYGWDPVLDGGTVPNAKQPDGSPVRTGRLPAWKYDAANPKQTREDLKSSCVVAGWGEHFESWKIELPNGRYWVEVCVGDYTFEQGPHHVAVEGRQVVDQKVSRVPSKPFWVLEDVVEVADGELNLKVGGYKAPKKSVDTSKDTLLNYLKIKRVSAK